MGLFLSLGGKVRETVPEGFRHGLVVEALGFGVSEVDVGLKDEGLPSKCVLTDLEELIRVEGEHALGGALSPELRVVVGQLTDGREEGGVVLEGALSEAGEETMFDVVIDNLCIVMPMVHEKLKGVLLLFESWVF